MKGAEELSQTGVPRPGRKAGLPGNLVEQWMVGGVGGGTCLSGKLSLGFPPACATSLQCLSLSFECLTLGRKVWLSFSLLRTLRLGRQVGPGQGHAVCTLEARWRCGSSWQGLPLPAHLPIPGWTQAFRAAGTSSPSGEGLVNSGTRWAPHPPPRGGVYLALLLSWPKLARAPGKGSWPATCQDYFKNKPGKNEA